MIGFSCLQPFVCEDFSQAFENLNNVYTIECDNNFYELNLNCEKFCSTIQRQVYDKGQSEKLQIVNKILSMGFSVKDAINYVYPNFEEQISIIAEKIDVLPVDACVKSVKNCKIEFVDGKNGIKIDKEQIYMQFLKNFCNKRCLKFSTMIDKPTVVLSDLEKHFVKCGEFSTCYSTSSFARKNNIKTACETIDGVLIKAGETFSFNKTTGVRNEENGYKVAKIIVGGKYVDGVGGGVCQVSSTLYNAAMFSGLEIVEVHNHTLPVGYVNPCFDAMVNTGSSDLKIKNQTNFDCIITACADGEVCRVAIYGEKPEYKIVGRFEKYSVLPSVEKEYCYDKSIFDGDFDKGENIISCGVDGYQARGFLDYYKNGVLCKTEKIRDNTYFPKKSVVLIVE